MIGIVRPYDPSQAHADGPGLRRTWPELPDKSTTAHLGIHRPPSAALEGGRWRQAVTPGGSPSRSSPVTHVTSGIDSQVAHLRRRAKSTFTPSIRLKYLASVAA